MRLKTITIVNEGSRTGRKIINASDFDAETMVEFSETPAVDPSKMKVADLKAALDEAGVEYTDDDKKPALAALLQDALDAQE